MKKQTLIYTLLLIGLVACKNNEDNMRFRTLNEGLRQCGNAVRESNKLIEDQLREKLQHFRTAAGARIWLPKAVYIKTISDSIGYYIDSLQAKLKKEVPGENDKDLVRNVFEKEGNAEMLKNKLTDFKSKMLSVLNPDEFANNTLLKEDIKRTKEQFRKQFLVDGKPDIAAYFNNADISGALAMLGKLQNDAGIEANYLLSYCNGSVAHSWRCKTFTPIVVQSSKFLKGGNLLEITAAFGSNDDTYDPKISINGRNIPIDDNGIAIYNLKVPAKPGKYFLHVRVDITKPDSSKTWLSKKMEYTVVE